MSLTFTEKSLRKSEANANMKGNRLHPTVQRLPAYLLYPQHQRRTNRRKLPRDAEGQTAEVCFQQRSVV